LVLDLNYTQTINFCENQWASAGPGARKCLVAIFGPKVKDHELHAMRWLVENQQAHWDRLGYTPRVTPDFHRSGVSIVDMEHALCEVLKYNRPLETGKFVGNPKPIQNVHLPSKWLKGATGLEGRETEEEIAARRPDKPFVDGEEYEVSHIVTQKNKQYRVRWLYYTPDTDTFMGVDELKESVPEVLEDWKAFVANNKKVINEVIRAARA
jgi:hypothetical protein